MAEPTRAQQRRIISSGEALAPERSGLNTFISNLAAGLPTDLAAIAEAPEYIKSAAVGAFNSATDADVDFGEAFARSMYGEEGAAAIQDFMSRSMADYLSQLPPELANDPNTQKDIEAAIMGSEAYYHLTNQYRTALSQWSEGRQNEIQEQYGLPPVWQQSTVDELTQMIPGLLMPTPSKVVGVGRIANRGLRYGANILETFLPGVTGPVNAGVNAGVQTGLSQGMRYLGDMPNVATGEALTTDTGATFNTGIGGIYEGEAASAPVPFAQAPVSGGNLPFEYRPSIPTVQTTSRGVPINPDRDPEGGGGGWGVSIAASLGAAAVAGAAILRGRLPPGIASQVIQDVDSPTAAQRLTDTAGPVDKTLGSEGTAYQKFVATPIRKAVSKQSPIHMVAEEALKTDPARQDKLNKLLREVGVGSRMEIGNATTRTIVNGELPLLNRRTVPLAKLRRTVEMEMDDADRELLQRAGTLANRLDDFELKSRNDAQEIADSYNTLANTRNPQQRAARLADIQAKEAALRARQQPGAVVDGSITMAEVRQTLANAQSNQKVNHVLTGLRRIVDDLNEANVQAGLMSRQEVLDARTARPHFLPMTHNEFRRYGTSFRNVFERGKAALKGRDEYSEAKRNDKNAMYRGKRTPLRTNRSVEGKPLDEMSNLLNSLETDIFETHRQIRLNRAAQTFTEMVHGTADWGRSVRQAHAPMSLADFEKQGPHQRILAKNNVYAYNAGGMMHIIEAADPELARAMLHNPSSTLAGLDAMRRLMQSTFTSNALAPWFAWRGAEYELGVARATLGSGYSKGMFDKFLKQTFPNTKLSRTFDYVPDPTIRLQQLAAIGHQISGKALGFVAEHLSNQLMQNSTLIRALGPQRAQAIAQSGIRMANDMRSKYQFMEEHGILNARQVMEHNESIFQDFEAGGRMLRAGKPVADGLRTAFNGWTGIVDSVRNSVRYAVAAQNLEMLRQRHGGVIPNDVARKFIKDMKYMSGDMTRALGNPLVAKAQSFVPYGQNALNSTLHMVDSFRKNKLEIGTRIFTNMVLPKAASVYLLTQWFQGDDPNGPNEFVEHYWDNMPAWQRMSSVPVLSSRYMLEIATGAYRKPTINDVVFMAQAPEAIPVAEAFMAMLQASGIVYGAHAQDKQSWKDAMSGIFSFMNTNMPIAESWQKVVGASEKDLSTGLSQDSETSRRIGDAITALFGGAVDVTAAAFSAGGDAWDKDSNLADVFGAALSHAKETVIQKFPETHLSPLFGGQRRHYTRTQVRERNLSTFDKIKDVSRQLTNQKQDAQDRAAQEGLARPGSDNPAALDMMRTMHSYAESGIMKTLRSQRSKLYRQIERYDENRGSKSPTEYTQNTERLKMAINDIDRQEEEVFDRLNTRLAGFYRQYGVTDVDSAIAYVKKTMHP